MTPKIRLRPSASRASRPPSRIPLMIASSRKTSKKSSIVPALDAEIRLFDGIARQQLGRRARAADGAGLEQVGAVDDLQHLLHVLLDDQHGKPARTDALDQLEDLL